jgi:two-component system, chemotaxis family, sensor kinase CheA
MPGFEASQELLNIYIEDARGHLEALDHCLLVLEREGFDAEAISAVLGPLHTLKGNSGMMGFGGIKDYVHRLEDAFSAIAEGRLQLEPSVFDRLFAGASALRDAVERAVAGQGEVRDLRAERALLEELTASAGAAPAARPARVPGAGPLAKAGAAAVEPAPAEPAAAEARAAEARRTTEQYVAARSSMVRVDFAQLDHLLNLVGELIIHRTKLHELGRRLLEHLPKGDNAGRELGDAVHQVAAVSTQLQETVMDIRMLPIRHVFERFPRMVRDLARSQGKEIELILEGQATRVDKAIIDEIGEPLVHMVRNAIDHGIEPPAARVAKGKTPTGTILLAAAQESNHVLITIMDDGAGIDVERVRRKALEEGLIKHEQALSDRDVVQLIFAQGFSTSDAVTEVSGRGVGMDVVLKAIERLNGLVEVETVPGVGSKFIIQLPLTLAIISTLIVESAGTTYAVPLSAVVESIKFDASEAHVISGRETLRIRDRLIPLVSLAEIFGLPETTAAHQRYAVILGRGERRLGLVVDRLKGQQEVVIKALDASVSGAAYGVAGATIMGDGRVVLILDVTGLFDARGRGGRGAARLEARG